MEYNREEAIRARRIALKKLENKDFCVAQRVALQAQRLYPELENLSQLLTLCEVYCAAEVKINRNLDWYAILQVEVTADVTVIRKQYDRLAFLLHPNKNVFPGAEAAFKLVSEAHTILCDHAKRSLYDMRRQCASREVMEKATRLSDKIHAKKSGVAGCIPPYNFAIVFWTICPHCQKKFFYYQGNVLVKCDGCGENFFAFKLHEQAVPLGFLSAVPKSSQVPPEMISCQQHGVPNQQVQYTKVCSPGGNMEYESMVHATHTDEHIKWGGRSDGDREGSSETRSSVIQLSAVNHSHSPLSSGDKGTIGSIMLESADNFVINQNLGREDLSAVQNATGSCYLEGLGKRKQDDCAENSHNRDTCNIERQRMDSSPSDASSSDDKMINDDVVGAENQSAEHFSSKVDIQEEENATHEGCQEKYKKEATDIANQMHESPEITYVSPDFFDFGKLRDINRLAVDQIWAIYDHHDFMPRVYAKINYVDASELKVELTWLEHNSMNGQGTRWARGELPVACGKFFLGEKHTIQDPSMYLSHEVSWIKGKNRSSFEIHPKEGEIWALYKESSIMRSMDTDNHQSCSYDIVEISDISANFGVIVYPLVRIEGFVSLFAKAKSSILIPYELLRFSHSIPCYRTNGTEKVGVVEGLLELDTGALPYDLVAAFPSISLESYLDLNKKRATEFVSVRYPDSEFHNFDEGRSHEKFKRGQIWALYSDTDTFPNLYGLVSKVEKEPFRVHLSWLKACPQDLPKHWLEQDIAVRCGNFEIRNSISEHYETCAFSHLVETNCQIVPGRQVKILPKVGEVWAIYKNWPPDLVPSSKHHPAKYAIGEIKKRTGAITQFAFLTKVEGHVSVFRHDVRKRVLEIPKKENMRFSHQIPSFRLTNENGGKLRGFYELDPAAVPDISL